MKRGSIVVAMICPWIVLACQGAITDPRGSGPSAEGRGATTGPLPAVDPGDATALVEPAPSLRFARLSHTQWERTVQRLLRLDGTSGVSETFRIDGRLGENYLFDHQAASLLVDGTLWGSYQRGVADLLDRLIADPGFSGRIGADAPAQDFLVAFGQRAFRRPLTVDEVAQMESMVDAGPDLYPALAPDQASLRHVLEGFLLSPFFLYRIERSDEEKEGVVVLDDWEIASRLSYGLWNNMPDDALFAAASRGELVDPAALESHVRRMLADPLAADVIESFHEQWLKWDDLEAQIEAFEGERAPVGTGVSARTEAAMFVRSLFDDDAGFADFVTSPVVYADSVLAEVYDVAPPSNGFEERRADRRHGWLTQMLLLAGYERGGDPDIIHRGLFVSERLLCNRVPPPPPDATTNLPTPTGTTNRERTVSQTSGPACRGCHDSAINPFGFPLEAYGADGRFRTTDNGAPVDTEAEILIDGEVVPIATAEDLAREVGGSFQAHACYVGRWHEYLHGRERAEKDGPLIAQLAVASQDGASLREVLAQLVTARSFVTRALEAP